MVSVLRFTVFVVLFSLIFKNNFLYYATIKSKENKTATTTHNPGLKQKLWKRFED